VVTDAQQAILSPPVGTGAGMVMRKVVPAAVKEKGRNNMTLQGKLGTQLTRTATPHRDTIIMQHKISTLYKSTGGKSYGVVDFNMCLKPYNSHFVLVSPHALGCTQPLFTDMLIRQFPISVQYLRVFTCQQPLIMGFSHLMTTRKWSQRDSNRKVMLRPTKLLACKRPQMGAYIGLDVYKLGQDTSGF